MAIEKIKKFVREHKKEIIIGSAVAAGTAVLAVVGVKCGVPKKFAELKQNAEYASDFNNQLCVAMTGCKQYLRLEREDIADLFAKADGSGEYVLVDPDGRKLRVESMIAFGNEIEV